MIRRQKGAVLILLFVALIISAATVILGALNNRSPQLRDLANKQQEMQRIKETLLSYAMTYPDYNNAPNGPGRLPCSDADNDGLQPDCIGNAVGLGRLLEQVNTSVGSPVFLSDRYADSGQQFWYAVAPAFRQNSSALNTNSASAFTLDGTGGVAAVIIAPGPALDGQVRVNNSQANRYLELGNITGPAFVTVHPTDPSLFNDMVVPISVAELMTYATARVAQEIRRVLDIYYSANGNVYPADSTAFAAAMSTNGAAWVAANSWVAAVQNYTFSNADNASVKFTNCAIVYSFDHSKTGFSRSPSSC